MDFKDNNFTLPWRLISNHTSTSLPEDLLHFPNRTDHDMNLSITQNEINARRTSSSFVDTQSYKLLQ